MIICDKFNFKRSAEGRFLYNTPPRHSSPAGEQDKVDDN